MALSGSVDFSLTAREAIKFALRKAGILGITQSLDDDLAAVTMEKLELMLKSWQLKGPHLWKKVEGSVSLTNATQSYTLSTLNPLRILSIRYRNSSSVDLPMRRMSRERYFDLPVKSSAGTPSSFYFDPQRGSPTLYVWPVQATVTTETFQITYQKRIEDIDALDNDIDVEQEWLETVGYNLAVRIMHDYPVEGRSQDDIAAFAAQLKQEAMDFDREDTISFDPSEY